MKVQESRRGEVAASIANAKNLMNDASPTLKALKRGKFLELSKWYMGILSTNLAEPEEINGAFFLVEATLVPGTEPPPHVHSREDELFYVLEGAQDPSRIGTAT